MIDKKIEYIQGDHDMELLHLINDDPQELIKTASFDPVIANYIASLEKENGYLYALVNALTAGEYYGPNRNGDFFPEEALKKYHNTFTDYGYVYKHHQNKDPKKSLGKVIFSHYNDGMKRVELVIKLKKEHPDVKSLLEKILQGDIIKTSMGCFTAGTKVILADGSLKNIESIKIGDKVRTHLGNVKKVTNLEPRSYNGKLITLKTPGKYVPDLTCTEDHPIFVIREKDFYKSGKTRNKNLSLQDAVWVRARDIKKGDTLIIPKFKKTEYIDSDNNFAKTAGYYLAEGHTHNKDNGISFSINTEDQSREDLLNILPGNATERLRNHSENSVTITTFDASLKSRLLKVCGKYSHYKKLNEEIFNWSDKDKKIFLGAYIDGDGFFHEGQAYLSSCNKELLLQIQYLANSVGVKSTLGINKHGPSSIVEKQTVEYILRFFKTANNVLYKYCSKIPQMSAIDHGGKGGPYMYEDFISYKISKIEIIGFKGAVFNFEVEGDNSYLVEAGYAVHNCKVPFDTCSISGKRAKTRAEYSPYLLNQMNQVLPDGRRVYAINTQPRFFDLSIVTIPADPVSSFMKT